MRTHVIILGLTVAALSWTGCGGEQSATGPATTDPSAAAETLSQMLEIAERSDWGAYVDRYYGEKAKLTTSAYRDALVLRFERDWGEELLPALRRAAAVTPRIEGDKAVFEDADGPAFVLHRSSTGEWRFHL